jgi:hypothetical protein
MPDPDIPRDKICSICGNRYAGYGNTAYPVNDGRCCDGCYENVVVLERVERTLWVARQRRAARLAPRGN